MKNKMIGNILLLITAMIWGSAFVAQSVGMDYVGPFTYMFSRYLIGGIVLIPLILVMNFSKPKEQRPTKAEQRIINKNSVTSGIICGILLFLASAFQQFGICYTTAGKAGFITALYIIMVPLIGLFLGKKVSPVVWGCVILAIIGFYFLCIKDTFSISIGDLLVLCCALFFSFHIMAIDKFTAGNVDCIKISCVQFLTASLISLPLMFIFEEPTLSAVYDARLAILYAGIMSSGVAYTLQIVGQKKTDPTSATLIMSLESVFAAIADKLILNKDLNIFGCVLIFIAIISAQLPIENWIKKKTA